MPSPSRDLEGVHPLAGQLVVFTGKLSSLGRRDACALVARLGGQTADEVSNRTTILVVGAEGFGSMPEGHHRIDDKSNKLKRAEELNAEQSARIQILSESEFCELAGVRSAASLRQQYHAMRDLLARYNALREDHLRYLVKCGILEPVLRTNADVFFAFPDLATIKRANDELTEKVAFRSIVRNLLAARHGQLAFDFRLDAAPAKIIALRQPSPEMPKGRQKPAARDDDRRLAEEFFRVGSELDEGDAVGREQAAGAYRRALELDPFLVPALINLANIHYACDEIVEAQALYERAIGLESDFFEAHFNLGNIYHDLGRLGEAQACYREALRLNPLYADAHFYLAVTFEKMGSSEQARPHWRAYQQLAPHGQWVQLAREFSE